MVATTVKSAVSKSLSTSTALVSLATAKKAVKKPSKVVRTNELTTVELAKFDRLDLAGHNKYEAYALVKKQTAVFLDKVLKNMPRELWIATQEQFIERHMANTGSARPSAVTWFSRLGLTVKKPKSQEASAVAKSQAKAKKGASIPKVKQGLSDKRVTRLSIKLQEVKTMALKREVYSTKSMSMLNLVIASFAQDESVENDINS